MEGKQRLGWGAGVQKKQTQNVLGFPWVYICQLQIEQLKNWTKVLPNHGSQVQRNTNDLQLERKGSSCTGPVVQWSTSQREQGDDQETGICPVDGDIHSINQSRW